MMPLRKNNTVFEIHISRHKRSPENFDIDLLAKNSEGYTGAEIEQAIISSLHLAFAGKSDISTELILKELKNSPPLSVTMAEKVQALYEWAEGRCVPAD